jgi:hypothetical protein
VDDGKSAVTVNYLKLRLDVTYPRNQWIDVRVTEDLRGEPVPVVAGGV